MGTSGNPAKRKKADSTGSSATRPDAVPSFTRDGVTYTARCTFSKVMSNFGVRRALRNASEVDGTFIVLEALFDEDALAALDDLDVDSPEMIEVMGAIFGTPDEPKDDAVPIKEAQFPAAGD